MNTLELEKLSLECSALYNNLVYGAGYSKELNPESFQKVVQACKIEADRQHVGPIEHRALVMAYVFAKAVKDAHRGQKAQLTEQIIQEIASLIEPVKAAFFRTTPVTFQNGTTGINAQLIKRSLDNLLDNQDALTADEFVKEFLLIHPYQDGNGRTAFVLYNFLEFDMWFPRPLPDYFGD